MNLSFEHLVGWPRHVVFVAGIASMYVAVHFGLRGALYAREQRNLSPLLVRWADGALVSLGLFLFATLAALVGGGIALLVLKAIGAA